MSRCHVVRMRVSVPMGRSIWWRLGEGNRLVEVEDWLLLLKLWVLLLSILAIGIL